MTDVILFQPSMGFYDSVVKSVPLGLLSISRYLDREGYKIKIIDQRVDKNWENNLKKELKKLPICFGTTSTTGYQILNALTASKIVKNESDIPIVWGGIHPTLLPKQTLMNKNIDVVTKGEGELAFYNLVKNIEKNKSLEDIKGICYKKGNKIIENANGPFLDLNKLPQTPYHLVNLNDYSQFSFGKDISMETSRGCPNNCAFCFGLLFNKRKWRSIEPTKVIENIKFVVDKFKVNNIWFPDDNYFNDIKRANKIAEGIINEGLDIHWNCEAHVNSLSEFTDKNLSKIEKSGLRWLELGVESGSQKILDLINKNITPKQVISLNKKLKDLDNIIPKYNFISGFPSETDEDLKKTTDLILKLLKDNSNAIIQTLFSVTPYPRTEIFNIAVKNGFIPPTDLEGWINFNPESWMSNIPWLNKKQIKNLKLLYFSSLFIDDKLSVHKKSFILELFKKIYKPIGKYRFKSHSTKFPIELLLLDLYFKKFYY